MSYFDTTHISAACVISALRNRMAASKRCALCKRVVDSVQITEIDTVASYGNGHRHFLVEVRCHGQNRIDKYPILNLLNSDGSLNYVFLDALIVSEVFEPQASVGELEALQLRIAEIKAEFERSQHREKGNPEIKRRIKLDPAVAD